MREGITAEHLEALEDDTTFSGIFVRLLLSHQPQLPENAHTIKNFWTGSGNVLDRNGGVWFGVGGLGEIRGLNETSKVKVHELNFTLSGVPTQEIIDVNMEVRGFLGAIWVGMVNRDRRIVGDLIKIDEIVLSRMEAEITGDVSKIYVFATKGILDLTTPTKIAWSSEEQKSVFPFDVGFDEIPKMIDRNVIWRPGPRRTAEN